MTRVWLSWSSGKDSAWALKRLREDPAIEVTGLLTTVDREDGRIAIHAVRGDLLDRQATELGVPLVRVPLPQPARNDDYERAMHAAFERARAEGVQAIAYGDLFLDDVRAYRERVLRGSELDALFPLWGEPTEQLAREMVDGGLRAVVTCIDPRRLQRSFAGRVYDEAFLDDLPAGVDPCGEHGEFHTFVTDGPMLRQRIPVRAGKTTGRSGFLYTDFRLAPSAPGAAS